MKYSIFMSHAVIAIIVTILCGLIYATVQHSHRSGANDPQLQMARDISSAIQKNSNAENLLPKDTVEIAESLSPFVVFYNNNGEPVQSNGLLDGSLPEMPQGVFDFARKNKENVLTWQPRKGVRMAMVIESVPSPGIAFVAAGRSLKVVEKRVGDLIEILFIGWLICIAVIIVHGAIVSFSKKGLI